MQQKKSINDEIEMNPIFAYNNRNSTNYTSNQYTKEHISKIKRSIDKKAFHSPLLSNMKHQKTKPNSQYQPINTVIERKGTETTITTISDGSHLTSRAPKEFEVFDPITITEPNTNNYSTIPTQSRNSANIFIKKRISRSPTNYIPHRTDTQQKEYIINLEDLMLIEQKLSDIITSINNKIIISNSCFEWWNFYFNCSLNGNLEHYFADTDLKNIIQFYSNVQFLTIMLIYDLSFDDKIFQTLFLNIKHIIHLLHKSFLVICDYLLSKIKKEFSSFLWVNKLKELLKSKEGYMISTIHIKDINFNSNCAYEYIRLILTNSNMRLDMCKTFQSLFDNIKEKTADDFNQKFLNSVLRISNPKGSVVASFLLKSSEKMAQVKTPYIKTKPSKPFTLVLDLDETLMNFTMSEKDETQGLMRLRPGLYDFLDSVDQFYELIVFTAATQDYADPILNAIENGRKYFTYRFYREHTVIVQNDFVKDITRIGREISRTIIVDNMPQNFRLQKENGILILSFLGEEQDDIALIRLKTILLQIAKEDEDVRVSLKKYKDEITKKVSSRIYKH